MYHNRILCVVFTLILAIGIIMNAAEAEESLTISTSNDVYYSGDFVVVYGSVPTVFENMPMTIQIHYDSNLVEVAQIEVAQDGTFFKSFNASGPLWLNQGTYQITAQYSTITAEINFEFFQQVINKSSAAFPVNIPNSGSFDIGYTIRGGEVNDMSMNQDRRSILVEITMNTNGNLVLKLPRQSFDAQKSDGADDIFIILISKENETENFSQIEYEEIAVGENYRTIRIPLEENDKWVDVIGTYVIPEFGSIVIIILIVAISSAIIISKSRFSVRYN